MCTTIFLRRPGQDWPLLFAGNRDEMINRPWKAPGRHWPDREETVGGLDELSGGSWLGLNDHGLLSVVLNRYGTLGPAAGKRTRGELVLEALDHSDAKEAAEALSHLDPAAYRGFNLVIADNQSAFWLRHSGEGASEIERFELPIGLSMITAYDMNDPSSERTALYLPKFKAAPPPDPASEDWSGWEALMQSRETAEGDPGSAMTVVYPNGFETVSSSLIALPSPEQSFSGQKPIWRFAEGRPDQVAYSRLAL